MDFVISLVNNFGCLHGLWGEDFNSKDFDLYLLCEIPGELRT